MDLMDMFDIKHKMLYLILPNVLLFLQKGKKKKERRRRKSFQVGALFHPLFAFHLIVLMIENDKAL